MHLSGWVVDKHSRNAAMAQMGELLTYPEHKPQLSPVVINNEMLCCGLFPSLVNVCVWRIECRVWTSVYMV